MKWWLITYDQGLDAYAAKKLTLNDCFDRYISQKYNLKETTKANYMYMYNRFVRPTFGKRKIAEIRYSDVKEFYFSVLKDGIKANTLENIHTVVHPALQLAVRDGLIVNNPSDSAMTEIKRSKLWDAPKRRALTIPQQKAFMNYLESDREYEGWLPIITVLLGTGMRIGDADGKISLNQQKPSKHAGLRRFGPEKFLQRNNEFMKERPIFYKKPIKTEKDFSTWLRCFYYTTKAVITEYIYF